MLNHLVRFHVSAAVVFIIVVVGSAAMAQTSSRSNQPDFPKWVKDVGSRGKLKTRRIVVVNAVGDGVTNSTKAIQQAIDDCAKGNGGTVTFKPGAYVTGALFLRSNVYLRIDSGVTLLGSQDDADYPSIATRVAGIEMNWPAALINVNDAINVKMSIDNVRIGPSPQANQMYMNNVAAVTIDHQITGLRTPRSRSRCSGGRRML